jgi:hypothetical protein
MLTPDAALAIGLSFAIILLVSSIVFRSAIRRIVIWIAEVLSVIIIVFGTMIAGVVSYSTLPSQNPMVTAMAVAIGTLIIFSVLFAFLFVLIDIAENTRRS